MRYDKFRSHFRNLVEAFCYPIFFILKVVVFIAHCLYFVFGYFDKFFKHGNRKKGGDKSRWYQESKGI